MDVIGVERTKTGRPRTGKSARKKTDLEKKVAELEALFERRDRDFLDLLEELRLARSEDGNDRKPSRARLKPIG